MPTATRPVIRGTAVRFVTANAGSTSATPRRQGLYDQAFERLDSIVQRAGGPEAIKAEPDLIPQVHIRGDVNAPWRCVAGTIYNVQAAGYPTVGFISNPVDPNA